jgi:hypothetical protein
MQAAHNTDTASATTAYPQHIINNESWFLVQASNTVRLVKVNKEHSTHGFIYILLELNTASPCWVGQSVPALVSSINTSASGVVGRSALHASSLYRILRREAKRAEHKGFAIYRYPRNLLDEVNVILAKAPYVIYVTKKPSLWNIALPGAPSTVSENIGEPMANHSPSAP